MRINPDPRLPDSDGRTFKTQIYQLFRNIAAQLNGISEGKIQAVTNAGSAAPTAGTYQKGDKVWNNAPAEAGSAGSKYVVVGWICVAAGSPGSWLPMRTLTGN